MPTKATSWATCHFKPELGSELYLFEVIGAGADAWRLSAEKTLYVGERARAEYRGVVKVTRVGANSVEDPTMKFTWYRVGFRRVRGA